MSIHSFNWLPGRVHFKTEAGNRILKEHVFTRRVPVPDKENIRMNLWITGGRVPAAGTTEVTITRFEFVPMRR